MSDQNKIISPFHGDHNHKDCQQKALLNAQEECQRRGLRLTTIRQQVLEIVWHSHKPIGAYDVLQKLQLSGHKPAPPTAYRALDFLVSADLIHRVESLNAYIGCPNPHSSHQSQFYICDECGSTAESSNDKVREALTSGAQELGFTTEHSVIEVHGICRDCQTTD